MNCALNESTAINLPKKCKVSLSYKGFDKGFFITMQWTVFAV